MGFLPIVLMFAVLYFLMIRPQMKRAKEHRNMVEALKKGDEVVTNGGIAGRVTKVGEQYVTVEIARTNSKDGGQPVEDIGGTLDPEEWSSLTEEFLHLKARSHE